MTTMTCGITQLNKINTTSRAIDPLHDKGLGLLSDDCVGASSVNIFKNKIDIYLRRAGVYLDR